MGSGRSGFMWTITLPITVALATCGCATRLVRQQVRPVDQRVTSNTALAQRANTTAAKAVQMAEANRAAISSNSDQIVKMTNAMNYVLIEQADVMFGFNKSDLDDNAILLLNLVIQKTQTAPQVVVKLTGFTDMIGSSQYNLALSRRRAEAVQRYLVRRGVSRSLVSVKNKRLPL